MPKTKNVAKIFKIGLNYRRARKCSKSYYYILTIFSINSVSVNAFNIYSYTTSLLHDLRSRIKIVQIFLLNDRSDFTLEKTKAKLRL